MKDSKVLYKLFKSLKKENPTLWRDITENRLKDIDFIVSIISSYYNISEETVRECRLSTIIEAWFVIITGKEE